MNVNIEKIIEENNYNPLMIGAEILEQVGYKVVITGYGYNSLAIKVYNEEGEEVYYTTIGD